MLWFAWSILNAAPPGDGRARRDPADALPRGRALPVGQSQGLGDGPDRDHRLPPGGTPAAVVAVALVFGLVNIPTVGSWALLGQEMRRWLTSERRRRVFNATMALLLVASLWPILTH